MNTVSKVGTVTSAVRVICTNLKPVRVLGVHEQVMQADRQAVEQEQDEGSAGPSCRCRAGRRRPGAPSCRKRCRPGTARNRRWRARSRRTGCATGRRRCVCGPAERGRDHLEQQLDRDPDRGPQPHHRIGDRGEHRQRHRACRDWPASSAPWPGSSARTKSMTRRRPAPGRCRRTAWPSAADRRCRAPRRGR